MLPLPHCLHSLLMRLCSQMLAPPHSLHLLFSRMCSQMLPQPYCLQLIVSRLKAGPLREATAQSTPFRSTSKILGM